MDKVDVILMVCCYMSSYAPARLPSILVGYRLSISHRAKWTWTWVSERLNFYVRRNKEEINDEVRKTRAVNMTRKWGNYSFYTNVRSENRSVSVGVGVGR